ncbi:hypothetical protein [Mycobacterium interjectum]|uniref:hypothetical protein n=1 Tax=Mycobacterium interjectum TaxID=33895 RepID=UPI001155EDE6|nr:hypothetical protein [Mycobacterium interjectum]MCV7091823.1 hypothetical protein [Mycobacterium interjectum]
MTRVRVSRVAGRTHDQLQQIGGPDEFNNRLLNLSPVCDLEVMLPFDSSQGLEVDLAFWETNAERTLREQPIDNPGDLRRHGVPLRYRGAMGVTDIEATKSRLECHLHPFGVIAMTTVDLEWSEPVDLVQLPQYVRALDDRNTTVEVGGQKRDTTFEQSATTAVKMLVDRLTVGDKRTSWDTRQHRLATVISGEFTSRITSMPATGDQLHVALHSMSAVGNLAIALPQNAFVAQWNGSNSYGWNPASLIYMLNRGEAFLAAEADRGVLAELGSGAERTSDRHRRLLLTTAYITALAGLVRVAASGATTKSKYFTDWARTAAKRLGRLYGPYPGYEEWGLVPRSLLSRINASVDVKTVTGQGLYPSENYSVDAYPT